MGLIIYSPQIGHRIIGAGHVVLLTGVVDWDLNASVILKTACCKIYHDYKFFLSTDSSFVFM